MAITSLRPHLLLAALLALVALAVGAGAAQGSLATRTTGYSEIFPTIYVNYTDQCTFTITNDQGAPVTQIPPGKYQVNVNTPTLFRNLYDAGTNGSNLTACKGFVQFQLTGPNVDLATTLDVGCQETLTLPATNFPPSSTFVAIDNNNPQGAHATFTTAATGTPPLPTGYGGGNPSAKSGTQTGQGSGGVGSGLTPTHRLGAILSAKGVATLLTSAGKHALNVPQGTAAITVKDLDAKATFVVQQNGSAPIKLTPAKFVGNKTTKVLFTPGIWKYYSSPHGTVHTFIVVG